MESVTIYNVYEGEKCVNTFKAQAPATSYAKGQSRCRWNEGKVFSVVEEVFGHVSSKEVRSVSNGKIFKCS